MSATEIGEELKKLDYESSQIRDAIVRLCWWMRGSITMSEAWQLSDRDREAINKLIHDNIETSKKIKQPIY